MKVLVTGATGFLGGNLVRRLLDEGHDVRIIKRATSSLEELDGLKLDIAAGDVTDLTSLVDACRNVDSVFHLAGLIAYTPAERSAMELVNVQGTKNVIAACSLSGVRKLVHLSSVTAIGAGFTKDQILNEDSPYNVAHLHLGYFDTKHAAENAVREAVIRGDIDAVMLNPSTIYGPADAKKGSRGAQLKVARGKLPFYPPGGVGVVSVDDVVEMILRVWSRGRKGERYIVNGENLSIKDLFERIARLAGVKPPAIGLPRSALFALGAMGDVMAKFGKKGPLTTENAWTSVLYHWFDSSKAQREFGMKFKPADYAIEQSIRWSQDHGLI